MDRRPAVSGAPLHVVDEPADDTPFDVSEADRYLDAGQLGMGGMGEVRATLDRRLDREVALKVTHGPATDDQRRMEREAVLAARLEHPGIVPVYDSGRTPDGRLFYTMRLLKGPTLQMALQDAAGFAERLRLVRRVLDAVQAVAYAHDRRVVHRDLKPANVVLGEHGQTMVVDWGLAVDLDAAPNAPTAGTPAYMPPEQAQGAAPSKTADVFALGGVLYAVLTGAHPTARPVRVVNPEVPADLAAVVDRAMRPAPADRYPDAGAMAEDLEAWFEGRQVAAYSYSPWELLVRLARAWRVPLAVAGVATLGLVGTVAVGVQRTVMERNRALDAESAAVRAEAEANASLADSLVAQALVAAESGDRALAEVFAVHALRFGEDPMARGLLGRFSGEPRPEILGDVPMSGCHEVAIGPGGLRVACLRAGEAVVYEPATGPEPIATLAVEAWSAAFDGRGEHLGLVTADGILGCDLSSGDAQTIADEPEGAFLRAGHTAGAFVRYARGKLAVLRVDSTPEVDLARCPGSGAALRSAYLPDGTPIAACAGRDAFPNTVSSLADPARIWLRMDGQGGLRPPSRWGRRDIAWRWEPRLGSSSSWMVTVTKCSGARRTFRGSTPWPCRSTASPSPAPAVASRWSRSTGGRSWRRSRRARPRRPGSMRTTCGSPTGGSGTGECRRWRGPIGSRWARGWPTSRCPPTAGGSAASRGMAPWWWWTGARGSPCCLGPCPKGSPRPWRSSRAAAGSRRARRWAGRSSSSTSPAARRSSPCRPGGPGASRGSVTPSSWRRTCLSCAASPASGRPSPLPCLAPGPWRPRWTTWRSPPGGRSLSVLEDRGRVWRIDSRKEPGPEPSITVPAGVAIAGTDDTTFVATPRQIVVLDRALNERARFPLDGAEVLELAVSEDGRWLATGHRDGTVGLYAADEGQQLAVFQGHRGRVVGLTFVPDGSALVSGSWDGTVRTWGLDVLEAPAEDLVGPITRAWGMGLDEALGR